MNFDCRATETRASKNGDAAASFSNVCLQYANALSHLASEQATTFRPVSFLIVFLLMRDGRASSSFESGMLLNDRERKLAREKEREVRAPYLSSISTPARLDAAPADSASRLGESASCTASKGLR